MKECTTADRVAWFLLQYRVTPHTTTGWSPTELLFGRNIRTQLDAIRPDLSRRVERMQQQQKCHHDKNSKMRELTTHHKVYVRSFRHGRHWLPGFLLRSAAPCSFMAKLQDGRVVRCHRNYMDQTASDGEPSRLRSHSRFLVSLLFLYIHAYIHRRQGANIPKNVFLPDLFYNVL